MHDKNSWYVVLVCVCVCVGGWWGHQFRKRKGIEDDESNLVCSGASSILVVTMCVCVCVCVCVLSLIHI